jgi:hypothetical protein
MEPAISVISPSAIMRHQLRDAAQTLKACIEATQPGIAVGRHWHIERSEFGIAAWGRILVSGQHGSGVRCALAHNGHAGQFDNRHFTGCCRSKTACQCGKDRQGDRHTGQQGGQFHRGFAVRVMVGSWGWGDTYAARFGCDGVNSTQHFNAVHPPCDGLHQSPTKRSCG